jgi:hypothetical protein
MFDAAERLVEVWLPRLAPHMIQYLEKGEYDSFYHVFRSRFGVDGDVAQQVTKAFVEFFELD